MSNVVSRHNSPSRLTLDQIQAQLTHHHTGLGNTQGNWHQLELSSHFQPIYSLAHRRAVGYEALVRVRNTEQQPVSPLELFQQPQDEAELIQLDRLCRAVHVANYQQQAQDEKLWLFLNSQPNAFVHGRQYGSFFADLLSHYQLAPQQIVLEVLETELQDQSQLTDAVNFFRELGCLIAIDDFGAGHSNVDRIWRVSPDIVKLDRSLIVEASRNHKVRGVLPGLVSLLHETGALVLIEGVETQDEALIAMDCDADFVQGYFFARPQASLTAQEGLESCFQSLWSRFQQQSRNQLAQHRSKVNPYIQSLLQAASAMQQGYSLSDSCRLFLQQNLAQSCFLLNAEGQQLELANNNQALQIKANFAPLFDSQGACWSRRAYFRRALANPGEIQLTRPYLSINDARPCITLSIAFELHGQINVLCGDLNWQDG